MSGVQITAIVALVLCGILAWGNLQSFGISRDGKLRMAAIWIGIVAGLTLLIKTFQGG